jgi:hypothetical protein
MIEQTPDAGTAAEPTVRKRVVRKKRRHHHHRRSNWRDRLRVILASNALFYLLVLAVTGGLVALFLASVNKIYVVR